MRVNSVHVGAMIARGALCVFGMRYGRIVITMALLLAFVARKRPLAR